MGGLTGLWVVLGAVALAAAYGGYRHVTDGRARTLRGGVAALDAGRLGAAPGGRHLLIEELGITRTPTVLLLVGAGVVRSPASQKFWTHGNRWSAA